MVSEGVSHRCSAHGTTISFGRDRSIEIGTGVILYSILLPGASREEALTRYRDPLWAVNWEYSDMDASATRTLPPPAPPAFDRPLDALLKDRTAYAGTPDEIVEALLDVRTGSGPRVPRRAPPC